MQPTPIGCSLRGLALQPLTPEYSIAIVCDSADSGYRAFDVCRRLISRVNREYLFDVVIRRFSELCATSTLPVRMGKPEEASVVVLATKTMPTDGFWDWLHRWMNAPHVGPIAICILGGSAPDSCRKHLLNICCAAHIPLLEGRLSSSEPERPLITFGRLLTEVAETS